MKIGKVILLNLLFILMLSIGVNAAEKYMVDDAKVLKQDTVNKVEENLSKIEKNTDVIVKIDIVKSLNGKTIDDYAKQYAKDNIKGDQYILFVTSVNDKKNKLLVGSKANNILSQADIENIASLPNQDYKANNFDAGIIKVGKALDEKVTTKAVKSGNAAVSNKGYSTSVQHKTNYLGGIMVILLIITIGIILFVVIRRKINNDYENRKKKFAQDNNLDSYLDSDNDSFHSADVNNKRNTSNGYSSSNNDSSNMNNTENSRRYDNSYTPNGNSGINNTTIIHENNNNNFVEGMIVGSMLSDSHHDHHGHYDNDYRREPERRETERSYDNEPSTYTSGDWDTGSGTSSWDSSSSDDSNSSSSSDSSSDSSSSSWDSSSDLSRDFDSSSDSSSSWDSSSDSSSNSSSSDW